MNYKPFDLKAAIAGKPVITRNGRKVNELHYFETATDDYNLAAILDGEIMTFTKDGIFDTSGRINNAYDLFMAQENITKWLVLDTDGYIRSDILYDTEEEAKKRCRYPNHIVAKVTYTI